MPLYDLILGVIADDELTSRNRVIEVLRSHGAVSPATAREPSDLYLTPDDTWRRLVIEGRVREGPTGHFYFFEPPRASTRQRIIKTAVFYVILILIPVVLILINRNGH